MRKNKWLLIPLTIILMLMAIACSNQVENTNNEAKQVQVTVSNQAKPENNEKIIAATKKYLISGRAPTISVESLYEKVFIRGNKDYYILSIRKPEDYAKGHIPGAINIPFEQMAEEANLANLPKDKKIIVVCYTGHTASQITLFLNQLGYQAYALKFGMMGWTNNKAVVVVPAFSEAAGYPTVAGINPY